MTKVSIKAKPTFTAEVSIPRPGDTPLKLQLIFKHRTKTELKEFTAAQKSAGDVDVVLQMVEGWVDVAEEFSREAMAGMLEDFHGAGDAIAGAYVAELVGARRGN